MSKHIPQQQARKRPAGCVDVFAGFACKQWALQQPLRRQLQQCEVLKERSAKQENKAGGTVQRARSRMGRQPPAQLLCNAATVRQQQLRRSG